MGFSSTAIVIIQDCVPLEQRGAATALNIFARNLDSTLGASALGAVLNARLAHPGAGTAVSSDQLRRLLDDPASLGDSARAIRVTLQYALHGTFWAVFAGLIIQQIHSDDQYGTNPPVAIGLDDAGDGLGTRHRIWVTYNRAIHSAGRGNPGTTSTDRIAPISRRPVFG